MKEERRHPIGQDLVLAVTLADIQTSDAGVTEVADPVDIALDFAVSCGGVTQHYTNDPDDSSNTDVSWNDAGDTAVLAICTDAYKPGDVRIRVTARIPDDRFHDDLRKEIADCDPKIKLY